MDGLMGDRQRAYTSIPTGGIDLHVTIAHGESPLGAALPVACLIHADAGPAETDRLAPQTPGEEGKQSSPEGRRRKELPLHPWPPSVVVIGENAE